MRELQRLIGTHWLHYQCLHLGLVEVLLAQYLLEAEVPLRTSLIIQRAMLPCRTLTVVILLARDARCQVAHLSTEGKAVSTVVLVRI